MKIAIHNIVVSIKKNQDLEIQKELQKAGIQKENIKGLSYLKRSIDSRTKQDI